MRDSENFYRMLFFIAENKYEFGYNMIRKIFILTTRVSHQMMQICGKKKP